MRRIRYTVVFTLTEPSGSFPDQPRCRASCPTGAAGTSGPPDRHRTVSFVSYAADDRSSSSAFPRLFRRPAAQPTARLESRPRRHHAGAGASQSAPSTSSSTTWPPDMAYQLEKEELQTRRRRPGVELPVPWLQPARSGPSATFASATPLAYAIDRQAIVDICGVALRHPPVGSCCLRSTGPLSLTCSTSHYDPARASRLLDEAGYPDPDGDGPRARLRLSLKVSNTEFNRLQSAVIQQNLQRRRHRHGRPHLRVRHAVCRHHQGQLSDVHLQWAGGRTSRPRHSESRVSLHSGATGRIQSRLSERSTSSMRSSTTRRGRPTKSGAARLWRGSAARR